MGFLPLTEENIAMVMLNNLGDAYGWGGMMDVEDCSGLIRTVYACFGLQIGRNGNWQWNMNMEKIDMANMSVEEKRLILDEMPIGAALCFPGHEMMYLGKVDGKYYVVSTVSSIMSPDTGNRLRTRDVMINTLDVKRANGQSWLQALNMAFMPCYAKLEGKEYAFPALQWYHDAVAWCLSKGVMSANSDGTFGIGEPVSRATMAKALWVMAGKPDAEEAMIFTDVAQDHTAAAAIAWAAEQGVMTGYSETVFAPGDALTREQMVTALWRYEQLQQSPVETDMTDVSVFRDARQVSAYAREAFGWACGSIVGGTETGKIYPRELAVREQLATILYRYSQLPRVEIPAEKTA